MARCWQGSAWAMQIARGQAARFRGIVRAWGSVVLLPSSMWMSVHGNQLLTVLLGTPGGLRKLCAEQQTVHV